MTHSQADTRNHHRILRLFTSGPGVLAAAVLGVWLGTVFSFNDLPERFQEIYATIYRTMALPFLALTIIHSIIRLRGDETGANPTSVRLLPEMLRRIRQNSGDNIEDDTQEIVASIGLTIGRFGMIAIIASVLTCTLALYDLPATLSTLASVIAMSVLAAVLISSLNGPGMFSAAIIFCGIELGLPVEALAILVIVLEPLAELLLIPVSVAVTHALVEVVSTSTERAKRQSARSVDNRRV